MMYSSGISIENLMRLIQIFFNFRDSNGSDAWYEPIGVIEHKGKLGESGLSGGHYVCDVKEKYSKQWFRTNDDCMPVQISSSEVSKQGYAILLRRYNCD